MQGKFNYTSEWCSILVMGIVAFTLLIGTIAGNSQSLSVLFMVIVILILCTVILVILLNVKGSFSADEKSVVFTTMYFVRKTINYNDVEKISFERDFKKAQVRGEINHYVEIIKFHCKDEEVYEFENTLEIDEELLAKSPERLKEQFEWGVFFRLFKYISSQNNNIDFYIKNN